MMDIDALFKPTVKVKLDGQGREIVDEGEQIGIDGSDIVCRSLRHPRPPRPWLASTWAPLCQATSYARSARSNDALLSRPSM